MTIVLIIAIAVMAGCMAMLTFKVIKVEQKAESIPSESKAKEVAERVDRTITTYNQNFQSIGTRQDEADKQIEEIISKLESIAISIGYLENRQAVDRRKLNDICTRYVLFREPKKDCGVTWASQYPCNDEGE